MFSPRLSDGDLPDGKSTADDCGEFGSDRIQAMTWPIKYWKANKGWRAPAANAAAYSLALLIVFSGYTWSFFKIF